MPAKPPALKTSPLSPMSNWPLKPFILAHRGARLQAPENTLEAFQKAFDLGVDGIECDVFLSQDGIPVIIHDETLDRTTTGTGSIWKYSAKYLQTLGVPTLKQVLSILPDGAIINIELKNCQPYTAQFLADQVHNLLKYDQNKVQVIISSFNPKLLKIWTRDSYPIGLLFEPDQPIISPTDWHPDSLNIDYPRLTQIPKGFRKILWVAPDEKTARSWIAKGSDCFISEFLSFLLYHH